MRPAPDPYRVLGVARGADETQIKAAHRRLAKRHHPDAPGGDEARFVAIQEAYQLLSDPVRRRDWDRRHAPGPVDARDRGTRARARAASSRWTREDPGGYRRARSARGTQGGGHREPAGSPRPEDGEGGDHGPTDAGAGTGRSTWSAEGVPWWEDFTPRSRRPRGARGAVAGANQDSAGAAGESSPPPRPGHRQTGEMDAFSRSSGAAWSSAARRHFRRDEASLPSRGSFRYRGSQVVTGAEARRLAEEEAAQEAAVEALFRRAGEAGARAQGRAQAFDHDASDASPSPWPAADPAGDGSAAAGRPPAPRASSPTRGSSDRHELARASGHAEVAPRDPTPPAAPSEPVPGAAPPRDGSPRPPRPSLGPIRGAIAGAALVGAPVAVAGGATGALDAAAGPGPAGLLLVGLAVGAVAGGAAGWLARRGSRGAGR